MQVRRRLAAALIVMAACLYGAADQYLGSRIGLGRWTVSVSQMSAPWLAIAFLAGAWPRRRAHAVAMGLLVTLAAVAGYLGMTLSPLEGVATDSIRWSFEVRSQLHVILPALVSGPAFGWLGGYWRSTHSRRSALLIAALFALEPCVRLIDGQLIDPRSLVWPAEVALGFALAAAVWLTTRRRGPAPA
jgi:cation transport ATPase